MTSYELFPHSRKKCLAENRAAPTAVKGTCSSSEAHSQYFCQRSTSFHPPLLYHTLCTRVSKNVVFGLNFSPSFWTQQISWIMPILAGFGPNPRSPKSGQGKVVDLNALPLYRGLLWLRSPCRPSHPPCVATRGVPSPWRTRVSRCGSDARGRTLALHACQSAPSSAHVAKTLSSVGECMAGCPCGSVDTGSPCHGLPVSRTHKRRFKRR